MMTILVEPINSLRLVQLTFFISLSVAMRKSTLLWLVQQLPGTARRIPLRTPPRRSRPATFSSRAGLGDVHAPAFLSGRKRAGIYWLRVKVNDTSGKNAGSAIARRTRVAEAGPISLAFFIQRLKRSQGRTRAIGLAPCLRRDSARSLPPLGFFALVSALLIVGQFLVRHARSRYCYFGDGMPYTKPTSSTSS